MSNKIAINYNTVSLILPLLKTGTPNAGTHLALSRKTVPALIWPPQDNTIGNVVFRDIKKNHTISVSFIKELGGIPGLEGYVTFVGVKKNHTINVTFYKVMAPPEPLSNHTKLLLLFNDNHTSLRPEFYMFPNDSNWRYYTDLPDVDSSISPWFTTNTGRMADSYASLVDFIKDDSIYDHTVCQIAGYNLSYAMDRSIGSVAEKWCLGWISSSEKAEGRSSFINNMSDAFDPSVNIFKTQYLPGCKLGVDDFTIDFWWKAPLLTGCGVQPYLEDGNPYYNGYLSSNYFFILRESNKYNYDGSYNNSLIGLYNVDTAVITYDPKDDIMNAHARMEYIISAYLGTRDDIETVILSGVVSKESEFNSRIELIDETQSWEIDELVGKYVTIISGTGSETVDSGENNISGDSIFINPGPKLIESNTETVLTVTMCNRDAWGGYEYNPVTKTWYQKIISVDNIAFTFPEVLDETSHYEITDNIPQYRLILQHKGDVFDPITHTGWAFSGGNGGPDGVSYGIKSGRTTDFYSGILPYSALVAANGSFSHIAFVRMKDTIKCYFNGIVLEEEFNIPFKFIENRSENYMMQVTINNYYGAMDVFKVNDVALWSKNFNPFDPLMLPNIYFDMELSLDSRLLGDNILLLLHMNGEDESVVFYDSSKYHYSVYNDSGYTKIINNVGVFNGFHRLLIDDFDINIDRTNEFTIDFYIKFTSNGDGKIVGTPQRFMYFGNETSDGTTGQSFGFGFCVNNGIPSIKIDYAKKVKYQEVYNVIQRFTSYHKISGAFCFANMVNLNQWVHFALVWCNSGLKLYINGNAIGDIIQNPYLYNLTKCLTIGTDGYGFGCEMDEVRISSRAEWTEDFIPPDEPYTNPPIGFNEVALPFNLTSDMEVIIRSPGEFDIEHNLVMDLSMIRDDIHMLPVEFNANTSLNVFMNVIEKQYDFVFSNRWLKELLGTYPDVPGYSKYKIALMNQSFIFNRDTDEYFVDQLDEYEIVNQNGYVTGASLTFKSFSEDGELAFEDLTLPGASEGVYGPIRALVIYDYDSDVRGLVVGCLTFEELIQVDQSTIKLSDLSFQIVTG